METRAAAPQPAEIEMVGVFGLLPDGEEQTACGKEREGESESWH